MSDLIIDSYSETNQDGDAQIGNSKETSYGSSQSFTGTAAKLTRVKWYLKKSGSPTGNAYAKLYAHSGTYGTSSIPTGSALATSAAFDISTLTTSYQLIEFTFSGANQYDLEEGTYYVITLESDLASSTTNIIVQGTDTTSPSHSGNYSYKTSIWNAYNPIDLPFYVYGSTDATSNFLQPLLGVG